MRARSFAGGREGAEGRACDDTYRLNDSDEQRDCRVVDETDIMMVRKQRAVALQQVCLLH